MKKAPSKKNSYWETFYWEGFIKASFWEKSPQHKKKKKAQAFRMMKETFELTEQEQQMVDSEPPIQLQSLRTGAPVELEESEDDDFSSDPRSSRRT